MILKNYTSDVPASETIHAIQQILIKTGVSHIAMEYGLKGDVIAITFAIQYEPKMPPMPVRIPAKVAECQQALWLNYADGDKLSPDGNSVWYSRKTKKRADFLEQGCRTAWRIAKDWLEVQLTMVALKQADFAQVFLPYAWDGKQTFYERLKENNFKALMPARSNDVALEATHVS